MRRCPSPWKRPFETEEEALAARYAPGVQGDVEVYPCVKWCGAWHLRDKAKRSRKKRSKSAEKELVKIADQIVAAMGLPEPDVTEGDGESVTDG